MHSSVISAAPNLTEKNLPEQATDCITARLVVNERDFAEAQLLRHDAYVRAGYLPPDRMRRFEDSFDSVPGSKSLVIYLKNTPAATVRICQMGVEPDTQLDVGLPSSAMFKSEIDEFLERQSAALGRSANAVEITRLARSPLYEKNVALVLGLYHVAGYLILHFKADVIFATVTRNHTSFYARMGFKEISLPKRYRGLDVDTVLMACLKREHRGIRGRTLCLNDMSVFDDTYVGLMKGLQMPVFGGEATSTSELYVNRRQALQK